MIVKSGMLTADVAQIVLAYVHNNFTKSTLVKMRASAASLKLDGRCMLHRGQKTNKCTKNKKTF